jgi:hypothetical protein
MKLQDSHNSFVANSKITEYLLNLNHEKGKSKAKYFFGFGFALNKISEFKNALVQHSIQREIYQEVQNDFGKKYELRCEILTPDSRNPCIVTVWIIDNGSNIPKLVTAYPF